MYCISPGGAIYYLAQRSYPQWIPGLPTAHHISFPADVCVAEAHQEDEHLWLWLFHLQSSSAVRFCLCTRSLIKNKESIYIKIKWNTLCVSTGILLSNQGGTESLILPKILWWNQWQNNVEWAVSHLILSLQLFIFLFIHFFGSVLANICKNCQNSE